MVAIYLAVFIGCLFLSMFLTWYVRNVALGRGWVAAPSHGRHVHTVALPRLGGVAIFASFIAILSLLMAASRLFDINLGFSTRTALYLIGSGAVIFLLGLYDDLRPVNPYVKLIVQSLAATLLFFEGFRVFQLPLFFGWQTFGLVAFPLTVLWVLAVTNAFNLIDGLDGLAAGSALFSTLTVFIVSLISHNPLISLLTIALAGAILGFLRYNFNPATIFLGDSGSLFIGFMLSALALAGSQKSPTIIAVAIPVVSFGLPILETIISVMRRWLNGQPLFTADREHIHHKLLDLGLSHRQVVIVLYAVSAVCAILSLFLLYPGGASLGLVLSILGIGIWIGVQRLGYHEFFEIGRVANRTIGQKRIIINNLAIRRASERLARVNDYRQLRQVLEDAFSANDFDAFHLRVLPGRLSQRERVLSWTKRSKASTPPDDCTHAWSLMLDLVTSDNRRCGYFYLHRESKSRSLLLDINLLVSGFQRALADAVDRTRSEPVHSVEIIKETVSLEVPVGAV